MAGLIYKELWHDPKTCEWSARWSSDIGWLWVKLISFVEDHGTRGYITEKQAATVADLNNVPSAAIAQLVEAHGLDRQGDGRYRIHNYGQRGKLSRKRAEAGKKGYTAMVESLAGKAAGQSSELFALANSGVGVGVVKELFEFWKGVTGKTRAVLDEKRRRVFEHALKIAPLEDVRDALQGWQNDPWAERRLHLEPKYLIGDSAAIEKFSGFWRNGKPALTLNNMASKGVAAGRDWADLAENFKAAGL